MFRERPGTPAGVKLGFQTRFAAHPSDAAKAIYHHFAEMDARLVFYRLGANAGRSICLLLCDAWFEPKDEADGYVRRDEWLVSFDYRLSGNVCYSVGNDTEKVVPAPGLLSTAIVPLCISTIFCAMDNPKPLPPLSERVRDLSAL